jgi:hypothetical protein
MTGALFEIDFQGETLFNATNLPAGGGHILPAGSRKEGGKAFQGMPLECPDHLNRVYVYQVC